MTDQELIELVRTRAPGELSPEQIAAIRSRLDRCDALRQALRDQLDFEERLCTHLARVEIDAASLWRAASGAESGRRGFAATLGLLLVGWVLCGGLAWWIGDAQGMFGQRLSPPALADAPQERPAVEEVPRAATGPSDPIPAEAPPVAALPAPERADTADEAGIIVQDVAPTIPVRPTWPELEETAPRIAFAVAAFQEAPTPNAGISGNELARWLVPSPDETAKLIQGMQKDTPIAGFQGLVRLRPEWPADGVLRMAPFEHNGMAIYFWNDVEGIALHYHEQPRPAWAAYRTTRTDGSPRPLTRVLLATDDDRYDRSLRGVVEVRHQDGSLVLSRGDMRLLTVPLAAPPREVCFDRRAWFRTFTMFRGEPAAEELPFRTALLSEAGPPARLAWDDPPAAAKLVRSPAGAVRLQREKGAPAATTAVALPRTGLCEIILQLDRADAATGIFLGDATGRPVRVIGLRRDRKSGGPVLAFLKADAADFEIDADPGAQIVPFAGEGQWLRILFGCGVIKGWVSGDGRHWGRALEPLRGVTETFARVGLIAFGTAADTQIGIRHLEIREMSELTALADPQLAARVPPVVIRAAPSLAAWCAETLAAQPVGVEPVAWRRACAVRTLSEGAAGPTGNEILAGLLEDSLDRDVPAEDQVRALDQGALLYDAWDPPEADRLLQCYDRLGRRLAQRGARGPFSIPGRSLMNGPLWYSAVYQVIPEPLVRAELVGSMYGERWDEVLELCRRIRFWNRPSRPDLSWPDHRLRIRRLVEWADLRARETLGTVDAGESSAAPLRRGPQAAAAQPSRDGLNVLADLQAALADRQFVQAGETLLAALPEQLVGLFPDRSDPDLLVSLPQAVFAAMQERSEWRRTMIERFGPQGKIRVQQAIARNAISDLAAAAIQFAGTPAAATAYRWLGDRALAEGNFLVALDDYRRALLTAESRERADLAARERLAAAFLGQAVGGPPTAPVMLADRPTSPGDFEKMISELMRAAVASGGRTGPTVRGAIKPVAWDGRRIEEWKGQTGQPPPETGVDIDWGARQLACVRSGDLLFVSNRMQVVCYNLATERKFWTMVFTDPKPEPQRWPLAALQPVVTGDRIFLRKPQRLGPGLCCIDIASRKELWTTEPDLLACSDPLLLQGAVRFFSTRSLSQERTWQLDLTALDPGTGEVLSQTPVLEMSGIGERFPMCQVTLAGTRLVATIGGATLCCDLGGAPLWLRRQLWVPPTADASANDMQAAPPLAIGSRVVVAQPGVLELACLDVETGRRLWHVPLPDGRRLLGHDPQRVYVETARGIMAVAIDDGQVVWRRNEERMLEAHWLADDGTLVIARREPVGDDRSRPLLAWLDARTGRETAVWPLLELEDRSPLLGPLVRHRDQLFAFFGRGPNGGPRELWKLSPSADPAFGAHEDPLAVDRWTDEASDPNVRLLAARFLPEWSQFGGMGDPSDGFRPEFAGQQEVLAIRADLRHKVVFARELQLPAGSRAKLAITAGHHPGERWSLRVRAAGRVLFSTVIDGTTAKKNWGQWEVDLREFAGTSVHLVVEQSPADRPAWGYWKRLEVVP